MEVEEGVGVVVEEGLEVKVEEGVEDYYSRVQSKILTFSFLLMFLNLSI